MLLRFNQEEPMTKGGYETFHLSSFLFFCRVLWWLLIWLHLNIGDNNCCILYKIIGNNMEMVEYITKLEKVAVQCRTCIIIFPIYGSLKLQSGSLFHRCTMACGLPLVTGIPLISILFFNYGTSSAS